MTRQILAQVTLPSRTGFAKHNCVNTLAIKTPDDWVGDAGDLGEVTTAIANFWIAAPVANNKVGTYISSEISRSASACKIRLYDATGKESGIPNLGSPFAQDSFTLPAANSPASYPSEVACVLTTRVETFASLPVEVDDDSDADDRPERPRQRGTGRIYVGPLTVLAGDNDLLGSGISRPIAAFTTALRDAANRLRDELAVNGHQWCIWSRQAGVFTPVHTVQTDDAWDTQRRRGHDPSVRTSLVVA